MLAPEPMSSLFRGLEHNLLHYITLLHIFCRARVIEIDLKCCDKFELSTIYQPNLWNHIAYTCLHIIYIIVSKLNYFVSRSL